MADPQALEKGRLALLQILAREGRARARVEVISERDPAAATVDVRFHVTGGAPETFGRVVVSGNAD